MSENFRGNRKPKFPEDSAFLKTSKTAFSIHEEEYVKVGKKPTNINV